MDLDKFLEGTREAILDYGYAIHYCDDRSMIYQNLPRAYTVGRTMWQRPELLIIGPFTQERMKDFLDGAIAIDDVVPIEVDVPFPICGVQFKAMEADPSAFVGAMAVFGVLKGLQLVWADAETGEFPGTPQPTRPPDTLPLPIHDDPYGPEDPFHGEDMQ